MSPIFCSVCNQYGAACVAELIAPYAKKAMRNRLSPKKILGRLKANAEDWEHLITILPRDTADILRNLKRGKFDVHLQHRRLEPVVNRLVMGILTAALFMGSASLCSNHVRPTIFEFSVPGFLGCGIALIMGSESHGPSGVRGKSDLSLHLWVFLSCKATFAVSLFNSKRTCVTVKVIGPRRTPLGPKSKIPPTTEMNTSTV